MALRVRVGVTINTEAGLWFRLGDAYQIDEDTIGTPGSIGYLTYPDTRVKSFKVFAALRDDDPASPTVNSYGPYRTKEFPAKVSGKANLSYALMDVSAYSSFDFATTYTDEQARALETSTLHSDPNALLTSTPYNPRNLLGRHTQYLGNDAEDAPVCFAAASKEISSGQFGQFPLYVFCKRSGYALEVGSGDTAFLRATPLDINRGAVSAQGAETVDRAVFYASGDGIFQAGAQSQIPLSFPLHGPFGDFPLDENTALFFFTDPDQGRRELWVASGESIFAYSLDYKRWFTLDAERVQFVSLYGAALGLSSNGTIYREISLAQASGRVTMAPIHMGEPDVLKRFRRVIARFGTIDFLSSYNVTDYSVDFSWLAIQGDFHGLTIEAEPRYLHRVRSQTEIRSGA